jgi:hypothetical protein
MSMKKKYLENIHRDLLEMSDVELQKRYWNNADSNHVSSYTELMCRLFDDDCFDDFINEIKREESTNLHEVDQILKLHEKLNSYDEAGKSDQDILSDPKWHEIIELARIIINKWPQYMTMV